MKEKWSHEEHHKGHADNLKWKVLTQINQFLPFCVLPCKAHQTIPLFFPETKVKKLAFCGNKLTTSTVEIENCYPERSHGGGCCLPLCFWGIVRIYSNRLVDRYGHRQRRERSKLSCQSSIFSSCHKEGWVLLSNYFFFILHGLSLSLSFLLLSEESWLISPLGFLFISLFQIDYSFTSSSLVSASLDLWGL